MLALAEVISLEYKSALSRLGNKSQVLELPKTIQKHELELSLVQIEQLLGVLLVALRQLVALLT